VEATYLVLLVATFVAIAAACVYFASRPTSRP
jgi:HAMP domain-containing protein